MNETLVDSVRTRISAPTERERERIVRAFRRSGDCIATTSIKWRTADLIIPPTLNTVGGNQLRDYVG